ncbi:hypothetical protein [Frankia sp. AgB32]|uniref:hypothetical protein n=1 Tax=Frankia sp. AgB32 TaxID=631119 RepID=UPI00200BE8C5|nr:hypothetical protein [Frankia sp. AgB32]MCK9897663.1 hypothetical protein [Frankia sp. AgB32]
MSTALEVLADQGLLDRRRNATGQTLYSLTRWPGLSAGRPVPGWRELWHALAAALTPSGELDDVAEVLDSPAGHLDRTWLALRAATWMAGGLLAVTGDGQWTLTAQGRHTATAVRIAELDDQDVWAALAATRPPGDDTDRVDWPAVAQRLGARPGQMDMWMEKSCERGLLARTGHGTVPTIIGLRQIAAGQG